MECGGQHGVWRAAWSVAGSMECGGQHGVWWAAWSVVGSMECGGQHGGAAWSVAGMQSTL